MSKYNIPQDLIDQLTTMKKRIERLERAPRLTDASVGPGGTITINAGGQILIDGGVLTVRDAEGETTFYVGFQSGALNRPDGTAQPVIQMFRDDGSYVLTVMDPDPLDPGGYHQVLKVYDRATNVIFAEDEVGTGLARPYIPWSVRGKSSLETTTVDTPSWDTMYTLRSFKQHPKLHVTLQAVAGASTTGNVRLYHVASSTVLAGPDAIPSGGTQDSEWLADLSTLYSHIDMAEVEVQAQRLTGANSISVRLYTAFGHES